jgi:hypothetical protein
MMVAVAEIESTVERMCRKGQRADRHHTAVGTMGGPGHGAVHPGQRQPVFTNPPLLAECTNTVGGGQPGNGSW